MSRFSPRTRLLGSGSSARVAQWMQRSVIKSIQRGTISISAVQTTNTATITTVVPENTRLIWLGQDNDDAGAIVLTSTQVRLALTNATTITATRVAAGNIAVVGYEVIEYWPGVIKSVQRGTVALVTAAAATATITAVNTAKSELNFLGYSVNSNSANDITMPYLTFTNATTITATRDAASAAQADVAFQVTEWF